MVRKSIPAKKRLQVLKRDNFTCQMCGKSPALYPELEIDAAVKLEIDHAQPHSKNGTDDISNLQTLCLQCNRGKGNEEKFNQTVTEKINNLLDKINPLIREELSKHEAVSVVANDADFAEIQRLIGLLSVYEIESLSNSIFGYGACYQLGIYTVQDNYAAKVNFVLKNKHGIMA